MARLRASRRVGRSGARGVSMVEFALVAPLAILLLVGVVDFGRAAYDNNVVGSGAREGARALVPAQEAGKSALALEQDVVSAVQRTLGGGVILDTSGPGNVGGVYNAVALGANKACPSSVAANTARVYQDATTFNTVPHGNVAVTITVCYAYQPWTPLIANVVRNGILEGSSTTMTTEY